LNKIRNDSQQKQCKQEISKFENEVKYSISLGNQLEKSHQYLKENTKNQLKLSSKNGNLFMNNCAEIEDLFKKINSNLTKFDIIFDQKLNEYLYDNQQKFKEYSTDFFAKIDDLTLSIKNLQQNDNNKNTELNSISNQILNLKKSLCLIEIESFDNQKNRFELMIGQQFKQFIKANTDNFTKINVVSNRMTDQYISGKEMQDSKINKISKSKTLIKTILI
jgi:hypothetical protein